MSARTIRLLHVEDDLIQRRLIQEQLNGITDYRFQITPASSEDEAVTAFTTGFDCVLMDYNLSQGNGLSCLKRLRQSDPQVPIIAISGTATPEVAAELLDAGADDYFSKSDLTPTVLAQSLRAALARADAWKKRAGDAHSELAHQTSELFEHLAQRFLQAAGPDLQAQLDRFEESARQARLTVGQLQRLFDTTCNRLEAAGETMSARKCLRPVLLELFLRLFDNLLTNDGST